MIVRESWSYITIVYCCLEIIRTIYVIIVIDSEMYPTGAVRRVSSTSTVTIRKHRASVGQF